MNTETAAGGTGDHIPTKIYTTADGRAVMDQSAGSAEMLSAEQILTVIAELHTCYDYCAAWKDKPEVQP